MNLKIKEEEEQEKEGEKRRKKNPRNKIRPRVSRHKTTSLMMVQRSKNQLRVVDGEGEQILPTRTKKKICQTQVKQMQTRTGLRSHNADSGMRIAFLSLLIAHNQKILLIMSHNNL